MYKKITATMAIVCLVALFAASNTFAAGTPATFDRTITNTVTADYVDINNKSMAQEHDTVSVSVHYVYGVTITPAPSTILSNNLGTVDYEITVTNNGNASDSFTVANSKSGTGWDPASVKFYNDNGSDAKGTIIGTGAGPITTNVLAAAGTQKFWVEIVIPDGVAPASNIETITATSMTNTKDKDGNSVTPVFDTATLTTTTDSANLSGSDKAANKASYKANETITYTIHLINSGTVPATSVVVTDTIPGHVTFVPTAGWTLTSGSGGPGSVVTSSAATVPAKVGSTNGTLDIGFTATVNNETPGIPDQSDILNSASIAFKSGTDTTSETPVVKTVNVKVDAPKLSVTKTSDVSSALPGGTINYHVTVTNTGHDTATTVVIADTLSGFVTFGKILHASDGAPYIDPLNCAPGYAASVVSGNVTGGSLTQGDKAEFYYRVTVNAN